MHENQLYSNPEQNISYNRKQNVVPLDFGVIFGIEKYVYLILTNNKQSPDGGHSNSELRALSALSAVAQLP